MTPRPTADPAASPGKARRPGAVATPLRLQAAIDLIVERVQPDQIILFGSAARKEMCEASDLDLLVIRNRDPEVPREEHEHWKCEQTGDALDVILMDRTTAERGRRSAAYVQGPALEEGRTVYAREGVTPIPTGPTYTWNGERMVKSTLYEPDYAHEFVDQAERKWDLFQYARHPVDKCEMLQASMERALKALITAQGRRVRHRHDLNALWDEAEAHGERIDVSRNQEELAKLSRYAGEWQYRRSGGSRPRGHVVSNANDRERPAESRPRTRAADGGSHQGAPPSHTERGWSPLAPGRRVPNAGPRSGRPGPRALSAGRSGGRAGSAEPPARAAPRRGSGPAQAPTAPRRRAGCPCGARRP